MRRTASMLCLSAAALIGCGRRPPPGLIVICVDTLRPDYTEPYGAPEGRTPFLDRIARESVVFERAYSQANETQPSHASLFTSRFPSQLGTLGDGLTIPDGTPTLATALSAAGWRTGAMVAGGHLARVLGLDDGFQQYVEGRRMGSFQQTAPMAIRWLDEARAGDQPWLLFLHSYDAHSPYAKPHVFGRAATPGYAGPLLPIVNDPLAFEAIYERMYFPRLPEGQDREATGARLKDPRMNEQMAQWATMPEIEHIDLDDDDVAFLRGLYATGVSYADLWLGVVWAELEQRGVLDDSVVVILSDHGEELLDHGMMSHHHRMHDASTKVPLMVRLPGGQGGGQRVREVVELLDVTPTLLAMQGVPVPAGMLGRDLNPCLRGEGCPAEGLGRSESKIGVITATDGFFRLMVHGAEVGSPEMRARIERLDASSATLWNTTPGSGSEKLLDVHSFDPDRVARLQAGLLAIEARP